MRISPFISRLAAICLMSLCAGAAGAATLNVTTTGAGGTYTSIETAIAAANPGDTVLVADGTYNENIDFTGKAITVQAVNAGQATIDGHFNAGVPTVSFISGETRASVLSGFVVTGGSYMGNAASVNSGGVYIFDSAPTINGNTISANYCYGINVDSGDALIENNTITGTLGGSTVTCPGYFGVGINLNGTFTLGDLSSSTVINNIISSNVHGNYAGGILVDGAEGTLIQNNTITGNEGFINAGGILVRSTRQISIIQNRIYSNAISNHVGGYDTAGGINIQAMDNTVGPFIGIIVNNTITGNATSAYSPGESATELNISGDLAQYALVNNIIVGLSSTIPAFNCSVSGNIFSITPLVIDHNDIYNSVGAAYSGACPDQTGTYGNLSVDPKFTDASTHDYHLLPGSPAIDAGLNSAPLIPATDYDGKPRLVDATGKSWPTADLGIYEFPDPQDATPLTTTMVPDNFTPLADVPLNFTVHVTSTMGSLPTGTVAIMQDGIEIANIPIGFSGTTIFQDKLLTAGLHAYYAFFSGGPTYPTSESVKFYLLVGPAPPSNTTATTTALGITAGGSSVTTVAAQTAVTLTATVLAGSTPVATGQINFCDATAASCTGIHLLGTAQLTSAGTAILKFVPGIGTHSYKAVFAGTGTYTASSSTPSPLTVTGRYPTTTTITSSGTPSDYTLTATVTGTGASSLAPTGTVSFLDTTNANDVVGTAALVPGTSTLNFINSATPATGNLPFGMATGDFNNDGIPDIVVANDDGGAGPSTLTVLLGNGDGTFTPTPVSPGTGTQPEAVATGDFNGDGNLDLAVVNEASNTLTILLGHGDGSFTAAASPATGSAPESIATGDFNGDGNMDIAVANSGSNTLTVLLGHGDGAFTAAASPSTGAGPTSIAASDLDGDGKLDLVLANDNGTMSIFLGNGDGTFTTLGPQSVTTSFASFVAVGDFNGDGVPDLAFASENGTTILLLGKGDGSFSAATTVATGSYFQSLAVGDFNGDGKLDLVVPDFTNHIARIFLGKGDGTFTEVTPSPVAGTGAASVSVADFNGDGLPDLAIANYHANSVSVLLPQYTETATATASNITIPGTGTHLVDASYPGDTIYAPSLSGTTPLTAFSIPTGTVTASPEPSFYNDAFTVTATVTPPAASANTPTGTITFFLGITQLGPAVPLSAGVAILNIPANNGYAIRTNALTAVYSGDTNFSGTTLTGSHTISPDPTTTTVMTAVPPGTFDTTPKTVYYGQDFNVQGSVHPSGIGPLTGNYLFYDGSSLICTLPYTQNQCATVNDAFDAGVHSLTVTYSGDPTNAASTSLPTVLTILPDITTTTVVTSGTPVYQGQPVTFTATVAAAAPGNYAAPAGTVTFYDGGASIGTGTLTANNSGLLYSTATLTTSTLSVGMHMITAKYGLTTDFLDSVSAPALSQQILASIALPSNITLASSLNPAGFGQTISFTAAIASVPGSALPPPVAATGTVSFYDGTVLLGNSPVDPATGIATYNIASLIIGGHNITAQYTGDTYYDAGTSNLVQEIIHVPYTGPADFTLTLAQNPFPVGVGLVSALQISVTATNGWTNDVTLACPTNLPYATTCTLAQPTIADGNGSTVLVLTTTAPHNCGSSTPYFTGTAQLEMRLGSATLAGLLIFMLPRKRRVLKGLLLAVLCVLPGIAGCAGNCTDLGTWPGTYSIPITATGVGTTTSHTVNLQMQVNL